MRLADILPDSTFRLALKVSSLTLLVTLCVSAVIYNAVSQAMLYELRAQAEEEISLLSDILKDDGSKGLVEALGGLSTTYTPVGHIVGVFNSDNEPVAGNVSVAPDFVGWRKTALTLIQPFTKSVESQHYHTKVIKLDGHVLIVGRSDLLIGRVQQSLIIWLFLGTLVITLSTLLLGAVSSATSARKIRHMDDVLKRVADGESDVRVNLSNVSRPDQLDKLGQKINLHLDTLSELMTGIKSTASAVAHDLKTPLAHTQFSLYEAMELCEKGDDPTEVIENAINAVEAINTTFDTILRISRINAHLDRSHFQWIDIWSVIEKITELYEPVYNEIDNRIILEHSCDSGTLQKVFGDAGMLEQLLVNLLKNIQVHCPPGTEVTIRTALDAKGLNLIVQDNGPGIPEQEIENVLKPFHRVDKARTESGNGLGLTLIAAIARHHKASLVLENCHPGLQVLIHFPSEP